MRRTKIWWSALDSQERSELWWLERCDKGYKSSYIPDDCVECGFCGTPHMGSGLCPSCNRRLTSLIDKADLACK